MDTYISIENRVMNLLRKIGLLVLLIATLISLYHTAAYVRLLLDAPQYVEVKQGSTDDLWQEYKAAIVESSSIESPLATVHSDEDIKAIIAALPIDNTKDDSLFNALANAIVIFISKHPQFDVERIDIQGLHDKENDYVQWFIELELPQIAGDATPLARWIAIMLNDEEFQQYAYNLPLYDENIDLEYGLVENAIDQAIIVFLEENERLTSLEYLNEDGYEEELYVHEQDKLEKWQGVLDSLFLTGLFWFIMLLYRIDTSIHTRPK